MNYKDEALRQYNELKKEQTEKKAGERTATIKAHKTRLNNDMKAVFGEDVQYDIRRENDEWRAYMADFDKVYFRHSYRRWDILAICPVLDIPDQDDFYDWRKNPLNSNVPEWCGFRTLLDLGRILTQWDDAQWEVFPWPAKEESEEVKDTRPERFAELTLSQANSETRPFRIQATITTGPEYDYNWHFVVEYKDIELPFPDDLPF